MLYPLAILLIAAAACALFGALPGRARGYDRLLGIAGGAVALALALWQEGLRGGGAAGKTVPWPSEVAGWLEGIVYRSDVLGASVGAWCLLLGTLCLVALGRRQQVAGIFSMALLYSLAHTVDLRAFAVQVLLLALVAGAMPAGDPQKGAGEALAGPGVTIRGRVALAGGAALLLAAALLVGRTTGGSYDLSDLTLSALTVWPLVLVAGFAVLWLGLAPLAGWAGMGREGMGGAMVQALVLGVPVALLVLRLEALVTDQALSGTTPPEWGGFTQALAWLGAITVVVAAAGAVVWAGTGRWAALATSSMMGVMVWGLALDSPLGRYSALATLAAFGLARVALEMAGGRHGWAVRVGAGIALVAAPLTAGFVGLWLLTSALTDAGRPLFALALVGAAVLLACGAGLHLAARTVDSVGDKDAGWLERHMAEIAIVPAGILLVAGVAPGLWLPWVAGAASIAGGDSRLLLPWTGLGVAGLDLFAPLPLLGLGASALALVGWALRAWARSGPAQAGSLLPTALDRLQRAGAARQEPVGEGLVGNAPPAVWWASLAWLDAGVYGSGELIGRLATRFGMLLGRLEGRYYGPLAVVLVLLLLLAITR